MPTDLNTKAVAPLQSIARNHALIDGNKRLAPAGTIGLYGLNGRRLTLANDQAYDRDERRRRATRWSRRRRSPLPRNPAGSTSARA
jgi:prophage maintenance system killer protein